jgi:serine protease Do
MRMRTALATRAWLGLLLLASCDEARPAPSAPATTPAVPVAPAAPAAPLPRAGTPTTSVTPPTDAPPAADALSAAFARTAAAIKPSVVRIDVEAGSPSGAGGGGALPDEPDLPDLFRRYFAPESPRGGAPMPTRGTGSGFLLDQPPGYVVTNSHVIHGATRVEIVIADGTRYPAQVVGDDPHTDVGLVRFEKAPTGLVAARLGNSDALQVGQWVIAVGSPLGLAQTVTAGIVSGLGDTGGQMRLSGERVRQYIQTDALINPGNSGGPLVNLSGEVIGINTLINVGPGGSYGFAIPINQAKQVALALAKEGRVRYPYIGAMVGDVAKLPQEVRDKLGKGLPERGAYVSDLSPGAPAALAGLQPGDVVVSLDDKPVDSANALIATHAIGDKVKLEYVRNGERARAHVQVGELPDEEGQQGKIGVSLQTMDPQLAQALGLDPRTRGAAVAEVVPGSPADRAGLQAGDVIAQVDGVAVGSAEDAVRELRKPTGKPKLLRVLGSRGARFVTVRP